MKVNKIILLILLISFFLLVAAYVFLNNTTHIEGQAISFDYPNSWILEDYSKGNNVSYILYNKDQLPETNDGLFNPVTDQDLQIVIIGPESPYIAFNLEGIMNEIVNLTDPNFKILKNESVTIDNKNGFDMILQSSFNDKVVINEYLVLQDGKNFYEIRLDLPSNLKMNSTETKQYLDDFQKIAQSIKIN